MDPYPKRLRSRCLAWIACIFFFCAGHALIPLIGIEDDEALFGEAIYQPQAVLSKIHIGHTFIPTMLISYLGTLKAWIYEPVFRWFGTDVRTLREPMLLAGAAGLWLFYLLLRRISGERAALIGCGLLAVDSTYLLTICYDWGPVALQHLLLIGGVLLLVRFYQTLSRVSLFFGFFLLGLGLWDKALAIWMLGGIGVAGIVVLNKFITRVTEKRDLAISALAFLLGALPLVIYNVGHHWTTFRGNVQMDLPSLPNKAIFLVKTIEGGGLLGWLTKEDVETAYPRNPPDWLAATSDRIATAARHPRSDLLLYALGLAILLSPFAGWNAFRTVLFCLIAGAVAWFQMAIGASTGGSVHHTILLWPLPETIIAVSFAGASRRLGRAGAPVVAVVVLVMMAAGALVINEYYRAAWRNGGAQAWTDAIFALSDYLKRDPPKAVYCLDWGMLDQLRLLHAGKLNVMWGADQVTKPEMTPEDNRWLRGVIADPDSRFLTHTKEYEFFPGNNDKLVKYAEAAGYRREDVAAISDRNGRPVYQVYKLRPVVSAN